MKRTSQSSAWVRAALILQCVILFTSVCGALAVVAAWSRYAAYHVQIIPLVVETVIRTLAIGIGLIGLWRSKWWGWGLCVLINGWSSVETLGSFLQFGIRILHRTPTLALFFALNMGTLALLLHTPVRRYFLKGISSRVVSDRASQPNISSAGKFARLLVYFVVVVVVMCVATSFALSMMMGEKLGGSRGFFFVLYVGFLVGSFASFVFSVLITLAARRLGPEKLWVWLLAGLLIAPTLELAMISIARFGQGIAILGYFLSGPMYLYQVWWLVIPSGLVTSFITFELYPWAFTQSAAD
jgi:hypothetical protein